MSFQGDYFPTHPDLNASLTKEQAEALRAFNQGENVAAVDIIGSAAEGGVVLVIEDQPISVQSVEESVALRLERESKLGT